MKKPRLFMILMVAILLLVSCNLPRPTLTPTGGGPENVDTVSAMTVQAILTQNAPTESTPTYTPTDTPAPSVTTSPDETSSPSKTNTPGTTTGTAEATTLCDKATFVSETIPDGTEMSSEAKFIKTWTLKNSGTCTWNSGYSLVFVKGTAMTSVASKQITSGSVEPGQTIQVSVDLTAPTAAGTYRGDWMLRNSDGVKFGLGDNADVAFWVQIKDTGAKVSYFVDNMCAAQWSNASGSLPCPGKSTDKNGFVIRLDAPKLQDGTTDNEPALWTNPQATSGGIINGKYPAITINNGQHFKAVLGCLYNATTCDVKFSLIYSADGGADQVLQEWDQKYSSNISFADVDLSSLAGKSVVFTLKVTVNSGADQAQAFWLKPRLDP